ncbi:uncharacterized protein LOC134206247 [Armigeres subalbatus]|uniref:uncharacterized protein LOC134206247 n=1 Tax=Armigeres subalbatus TaxID=124917 RepID=UPI002ED19941
MLLASTNEAELELIYQDVAKEFEITSLGEIRHFLGMEMRRENEMYQVRLKQYIDKLLNRHGMDQAKPAKFPMDLGYMKSLQTSKPLDNAHEYRSLVGGLLYLLVIARPDIAAVTAILGRKFSTPKEADWTAAKRVLRYLKATKNSYLQLGGNISEPLAGYSDADWAGDAESRRSTSGAVFYFGGAAISWTSRRQPCVTLSSMEAEYVALSEACQETIWLRQLLRDFGETQIEPTVIKEENQGCLVFVRTERSS